MKSLYEILKDSKQVITIVQQFGFTEDVKIYCGDKITKNENIITLRLVISHNEATTRIPWDRVLLLNEKLTEILSCRIHLTHIQTLNEPTADGILSACAPITEEAKICELFGVKTTRAIFVAKAEKVSPRILKEADEFLEKTAYEKQTSPAEVLSKRAVVCETDQKKRKVEKTAEESDSPNHGNTESPKSSTSLVSKK